MFINFVFICFMDFISVKFTGQIARWFKLHFIINCVVCYLSFNETFEILNNPYKSEMNSENTNSLWLVFFLHMYHMLYFKIKRIDYIHHIFSVFLCTPIAYSLNIKLMSLHYFIGNGLPGGIDYFLLILVKNNIIDSLTEKYYNAWINTFIRIPGGIIASYITYLNLHISNYLIFVMIISFLNVSLFGKLAIENYIERKLNN